MLSLPTESSFTVVPCSPAAERPGSPFPPEWALGEDAPKPPAPTYGHVLPANQAHYYYHPPEKSHH